MLTIAGGIILGVVGLFILAILLPIIGTILAGVIWTTCEVVKGITKGISEIANYLGSRLMRLPLWCKVAAGMVLFALIITAMVNLAAGAIIAVWLLILGWVALFVKRMIAFIKRQVART